MQLPFVPGSTPEFLQTLRRADDYAATHWPILILGETGVGKEVIARRIHERSPRRERPFVPVNCGAIAPGLFESEFFGHEKGAFSGAATTTRGILRQAQGGTLFLDEIGDLDLAIQVKWLRFMDSGEVRPLGATRIEKADLRIIAATNLDLYEAAYSGNFRLDLLERLSVLTLSIPPLRQRAADIATLARQFLQAWNTPFTEDALAPLGDYPWPGNVRQLRNVLVRASVLGRPRIEKRLVELLLLEEKALFGLAETRNRSTETAGAMQSPVSLADIEKQVILQRLEYCRGNRKQTAKELGIAKSTLQDKLRRWKENANAAAKTISV